MLSCFYCGIDIWKKRDPERQAVKHERKRPLATMDHTIPRSRAPHQGRHGHGADSAPMVPACEQCNNEKGSLTIEEYRVVIAFRYGWISGVEFKFPGEENAARTD